MTPSTNNLTLDSNAKLENFQRNDPWGIGMTITAMAVVFLGLIILYLVFKQIGNAAIKASKRNAQKAAGTGAAVSANIGQESGEIFAAIATALYEQVLELGGEIDYGEVVGIKVNDNSKTVLTADKEYECERVIIATGAANRNLGVDGEEDLVGLGVSYCATCDGAFFREKKVAVVGGGNTALEDAEFLSGLCETVYIIHRRDEFRGDQSTVEKLKQKSNVEFILNSTVTAFKKGEDGRLNGVELQNKISGEISGLAVDGLFVAVGQIPNTGFLKGLVELDAAGYVISGEDCKTNIDGIYAAGDCRTKPLRQLATAAADGAVATM